VSHLRAQCLLVWEHAKRRAEEDQHKAIRIDQAAGVGMMLERHDGNTLAALTDAEEEAERWHWWAKSAETLRTILAEEHEARGLRAAAQ
jgi:hypothetical protein